MNQKNNLTIAVIIIIILAVIAIITLKTRSQKNEVEQQPLSQTDKDLNQAVASDTTISINENLNSIEASDTTGDEDLKIVDKELQNL